MLFMRRKTRSLLFFCVVMMHKFVIVILIIFLSFFSFNCSRKSKENIKSKIKIGVLFTTSSLPITAAENVGYFDQNDLTIEVVPFLKTNEKDSSFFNAKWRLYLPIHFGSLI